MEQHKMATDTITRKEEHGKAIVHTQQEIQWVKAINNSELFRNFPECLEKLEKKLAKTTWVKDEERK